MPPFIDPRQGCPSGSPRRVQQARRRAAARGVHGRDFVLDSPQPGRLVPGEIDRSDRGLAAARRNQGAPGSTTQQRPGRAEVLRMFTSNIVENPAAVLSTL